MNKKYLSSLVCGFGSAVISIIPGFSTFACCLIVPIASAISVNLFKKSNPGMLKIQTGTGVFLGLFTGLIAAVFTSSFEIIITYITKSNDFVLALPQTENLIKDMNLGSTADESIKLMKQMVIELKTTGFSALYTIFITLSNLILYSVFGMLGGLFGAAIINRRSKPIN